MQGKYEHWACIRSNLTLFHLSHKDLQARSTDAHAAKSNQLVEDMIETTIISVIMNLNSSSDLDWSCSKEKRDWKQRGRAITVTRSYCSRKYVVDVTLLLYTFRANQNDMLPTSSRTKSQIWQSSKFVKMRMIEVKLGAVRLWHVT